MDFKEKDIINWIRKRVLEAGADGVIIAISGGIDSALTGYLGKKAFPNNSLGLFLDIESSKDAKENAYALFKNIDIDYLDINLNKTFKSMIKDLFKKSSLNNISNENLIKGNIKARLRMASVYAHAQKNNYLVLETSNACEMEIGYFTKWGDGVGDLSPISHLLKSEVMEFAKKVNLPKEIIEAKPSADLWDNQNDEDELGFTYDDIEKFIKKEKLDKDIKEKIQALKMKNNHKTSSIPKFK